MFRFKKKPSSGSHSQCLAKITRPVQCCCRRHDDVVSAMAVQYDLCCVCVVHCASVYSICFNNSTFFYAVCMSWILKSLLATMLTVILSINQKSRRTVNISSATKSKGPCGEITHKRLKVKQKCTSSFPYVKEDLKDSEVK